VAIDFAECLSNRIKAEIFFKIYSVLKLIAKLSPTAAKLIELKLKWG